jgi:hypothetical protein
VLLAVVLHSANARAESALLVGFGAGGAVALGAGERSHPLFLLETGVDWLDESGFTLQTRVETTHSIDTSLAALVGWSFSGLRSEEGAPVGASAGAVGSIDREGVTRVGGRAQVMLGLWYSRAVLELDATLRKRLSSHGDRDRFDLEMIVGVTLRVVPWEPFRL